MTAWAKAHPTGSAKIFLFCRTGPVCNSP